ncbi:lysozyme inhibitor LprI family protein [Bacillus cereus]|uniref:lysozyme inhibitor LprI family protein n=1 Tax=Bacillus cereus TaxID=1396 RepID=UPI003012DE53
MKKLIATLGMISLLIVGCSNDKTSEKAIKQGELALANKEYDKALASFELALGEQKEDEKVKVLITQTNKMMEALKAVKEAKLDEANTLLEEIEEIEGGSKTLNKQAKGQRESIVAKKEKIEKYNSQFAKVEGLKNNQKFLEAKEILNAVVEETKDNEELKIYYQKATEQITQMAQDIAQLEKEKAEEAKQREQEAKQRAEEVKQREETLRKRVEETNKGKKSEYLSKLNNIEGSLSSLDYLYAEGITSKMKEGAGKKYKAWDDALNDIYGVLKTQLSANEMNTLKEKQRDWISYRDRKAKEVYVSEGEGTLAQVGYTESLAKTTKERCYELVEQYMK